MSMHIEGPWLSTSGKSKTKKKFRNAAEAKQARELESSWAELQQKWGVENKANRSKAAPLSYKLTTPVGRTTTHNIPSRDTGSVPCVKAPPKVYTGDKMIGISQMAKSNAVPVFNTDHITEIARMRR